MAAISGDSEALLKHFAKFSPNVAVGDRVGRPADDDAGTQAAALEVMRKRHRAAGADQPAQGHHRLSGPRRSGGLLQAAVRLSQLKQVEEVREDNVEEG